MIDYFVHGIITDIGYFYLEKNNKDYSTCYKEIDSLKIHNVQVKEFDTYTQVEILLERPGLLIGESGKNICALEEHLFNRRGQRFKVKVKEEKMLSSLYPVDWSEREYDCDF